MNLLAFVFIALLTKFALVAALPTGGVRKAFNASNTSLTCIFLTNEPNWSGEMENVCEVARVCASQLPDGLTANVSSAGPTDGQTCFLYSGAACSGTRSSPLVYPGYADLSTIGFDKQAVSWVCWKMCGYTIESSSFLPSVSTVQPTVLAAETETETSTTPYPSTLTNSAMPAVRELVRDVTNDAPSITTTLSPSSPSTTPSAILSITKTLSGFIPAVNPTSITQSSSTSSMTHSPTTQSSSTPNTAHSPTTQTQQQTQTPTIPSTISANLTTFSLVSIPTTTTSIAKTNTNTLGFSMSPSPVTLTHTFADGSTEVVTATVLEPVPTVPTASNSGEK